MYSVAVITYKINIAKIRLTYRHGTMAVADAIRVTSLARTPNVIDRNTKENQTNYIYHIYMMVFTYI